MDDQEAKRTLEENEKEFRSMRQFAGSGVRIQRPVLSSEALRAKYANGIPMSEPIKVVDLAEDAKALEKAMVRAGFKPMDAAELKAFDVDAELTRAWTVGGPVKPSRWRRWLRKVWKGIDKAL